MFRERGDVVKTFQMDEGDFTRGIQTIPIVINKKEYTLASGFLGVEVHNEPDPRY